MASSSNGNPGLDPPAASVSPHAGPDGGLVAEHELRIDEIVLSAAGLETSQREDFFDRLAKIEPDAADEAKRRLSWAGDLPTTFLAVPAAEVLGPLDQPVAVDPQSLSTTTSVERYEIQERLGEGGMAKVYKAFDRHLRRPVALKLLKRADSKTLQRFLREAQTQARVRHEYVLGVHETGDLGGQPYIAMHYVDGPTLLAARDETSLDQKVRLMAQVAEGLHAAHREGLVHRDVKPSNILVEKTPDGKLKPWVADFGIAMVIDGGSIWSATHAGTPYYIAPERLSEDRDVDVRSDVYSLGVTLYQFLSGELPFDHPSLGELLRQVREDPPTPLRVRDPSLPAELEAVIMKCLAKQPEQRYPSARALANDLWRFLDGEVVEAHGSTFTYRLKRSARKRTLLPAALIITGLLVALLSTIAVSSTRRAKRVATEAVTALDSLALLYQEQGRFAEAESLHVRNLAIREEHLGKDHPSIAQALINFSTLLIQQGKYADAEERVRHALKILSRVLPEGHWRRAYAESVLGASLTGLGQFEEAETLLLASISTFREQKGLTSSYTRQATEHLAHLYEAWERNDRAAEVRTLLRAASSTNDS